MRCQTTYFGRFACVVDDDPVIRAKAAQKEKELRFVSLFFFFFFLTQTQNITKARETRKSLYWHHNKNAKWFVIVRACSCFGVVNTLLLPDSVVIKWAMISCCKSLCVRACIQFTIIYITSTIYVPDLSVCLVTKENSSTSLHYRWYCLFVVPLCTSLYSQTLSSIFWHSERRKRRGIHNHRTPLPLECRRVEVNSYFNTQCGVWQGKKEGFSHLCRRVEEQRSPGTPKFYTNKKTSQNLFQYTSKTLASDTEESVCPCPRLCFIFFLTYLVCWESSSKPTENVNLSVRAKNGLSLVEISSRLHTEEQSDRLSGLLYFSVHGWELALCVLYSSGLSRSPESPFFVAEYIGNISHCTPQVPSSHFRLESISHKQQQSELIHSDAVSASVPEETAFYQCLFDCFFLWHPAWNL